VWDDLCARLGIEDRGLFDDLRARYDEPHRRYHDGRHLAAVVDRVRSLADALDAPVEASDAALLAAWFHDAVYDPRAPAGDNERNSAALARQELTARGAPADVVDRVATLVEATAAHGDPDGPDAALLFDADLAILAAAPDDYDAYAVAIREEYAFAPDDAFRTGRAAVLRHLLAGPLFTTAAMRESEEPARSNVRRELARLVSYPATQPEGE
jgi:predicted metal-dependent HD superfamily phosphohydrolase